MSYILDALQKAESDRRMESGDDLESIAIPAADAPFSSQQASESRRWVPAAVLVLVVGAAGAAGWWFSKTGGSARPAPESRATAGSIEAPMVAATEPVFRSASSIAPEEDEEEGPSPQILVTPEPSPAPARSVAPAAAPSTPLTGTRPPATAKKSAEPDPTNTGVPPQPGTKLLPNFERTQGLPQLKISGASYSDNAAHRMIIVNGEVIKEGQQAAPGVVVEVIGARSAILKHGGKRYNINY